MKSKNKKRRRMLSFSDSRNGTSAMKRNISKKHENMGTKEKERRIESEND